MTLAEFLENPIGKGDASIPNKSLILGALSAKYDKLTDGSKGDKKTIQMRVYRTGGSDVYWFWLVIQSESERDNTYDVVFKFFDASGKNDTTKPISKFDFQVFTNTPSFAYTYAYVYNENNLIIPELKDRLGRTFYLDAPVVRNRNENIMYDKYIYFGARYILDSKKMNRITLEMIAKPYNEKYLTSHIRTLETIMNEYHKAEAKLKKKKRADQNHSSLARPKSSYIGSGISKVNTIHAIQKRSGTTVGVSKAGHKVEKRKGTIKKK